MAQGSRGLCAGRPPRLGLRGLDGRVVPGHRDGRRCVSAHSDRDWAGLYWEGGEGGVLLPMLRSTPRRARCAGSSCGAITVSDAQAQSYDSPAANHSSRRCVAGASPLPASPFCSSVLESGISSCHGIIANVRGGSHWVLLTGYAGNDNFYVHVSTCIEEWSTGPCFLSRHQPRPLQPQGPALPPPLFTHPLPPPTFTHPLLPPLLAHRV